MASEKKIHIVCPKCSKTANIPIPTNVVANKESGAISIQIPIGLVCTHSFYAYIDKNFAVRDYLMSDLDLQVQADYYEGKKQEILAKSETLNLELDNVLKFIFEKDLRSLIMAGFIGSNLVFIENNPDQERFCVLFALIAKLIPEVAKSAIIMSTDKYLDYEKTCCDFKYLTVYNVVYKLSVNKPFSDSDSEPLNEILKILRAGKFKVQRVLAKNYLDYLTKFTGDVKSNWDEKLDKLVKNMKKTYASQQNLVTPENISVIRKKIEFQNQKASHK